MKSFVVFLGFHCATLVQLLAQSEPTYQSWNAPSMSAPRPGEKFGCMVGPLADSPKADGIPKETKPELVVQNPVNLEVSVGGAPVANRSDAFAVLKRPCNLRLTGKSGIHPNASWIGEESVNDLKLASAACRIPGNKETDSETVRQSVALQIKEGREPAEVVAIECGANPTYSCEIVKAAIEASTGEVDEVVSITESAMMAAPEQMRIISQCAIAAAPDALKGIQALLAKFDSNAGESGESAKSAKSSKSAKDVADNDSGLVAAINANEIPNPLELPPNGPPPVPIITSPMTKVDP